MDPVDPSATEMLDLWADDAGADLAPAGCCWGSASTLACGATFGSVGPCVSTASSFGSAACVGTAC